MLAWWWLPIMFILGACVGAVIMGVCAADNARMYKDNKRWWEDDE